MALTPISQIGKLALILGLMISALWAQDRETILYNFTGGADGGYPYYPAHLLQGTDGSIYGTTLYGGSKNCAPLGCGVVFRLSKSSGHWIENPIYSFTGGSDGYNPEYIIMDSKGNIYGLTVYSGTTCCGEVFKLALQPGGGWRFSVLHSFGGTTSDGSFPTTLVIDASGNLYGMTSGGGNNNCQGFGCGTVFELSPTSFGAWKEIILYRFKSYATDGANPNGNLVFDSAGNLYGTTVYGGESCPASKDGCGTVFELSPNSTGEWTETLLYKFQGPDGYYPEFLSIGGSGNLYGMTPYGGTGTACSGLGCGVIFQLVSSSGGWSEEVLYSFAGPPSDGAFPNPFVIDSEGNVLGTTSQGGSTNGGIAYELSQSSAGGWSETRLHSFGGTAGENPMSTFVIDSTGSLYSTATSGGKFGYGLVFKLSPF